MFNYSRELDRIKLITNLLESVSQDIKMSLDELIAIDNEELLSIRIRKITEKICKDLLKRNSIPLILVNKGSRKEEEVTNLYGFITLLRNNKIITEREANTFHSIRNSGNPSAHDETKLDNDDLQNLLENRDLQILLEGILIILALYLRLTKHAELLEVYLETIKKPFPESIAKKDVTSWNYLCDISKRFTRDSLNIRYKEKYNKNCYFLREECQQHIDSYFKSKKNIMVLTGKAGTGKSNLICQISENYLQDSIVWLQDCAHLHLDENWEVENYIKSTLGIESDLNLVSIFQNIKENERGKIILIFDSVNENSHREKILMEVSRLSRQCGNLCKIIITCRLPIWNTIKHHLRVSIDNEYSPMGPGSYVVLENYTINELPEVYSNYALEYHISTLHEQLSEKVKRIIEQPLFLKLLTESFKGGLIPDEIVLSELFNHYITNSILSVPHNVGKNLNDTVEFRFLIIFTKILYNNHVREFPLSELKSNIEIQELFNQNENSAFSTLVDLGLLSINKIKTSLLNEIETVFVTYERVFEFLLAEVVVKDLDIEPISDFLNFAQKHSYPQLRGAVELKLAFTIMNDPSKWKIILQLAEQDRLDGRQFLCDILQTIYDSGFQNMADEIIVKLSKVNNQKIQLVAIEASFSIGLTSRLIELSISNDEYLRSVSGLFLFQNWNKLRTAGKLTEAYDILYKLISNIKIDILSSKRPKYAFLSFISVGLNILMLIVDDPKSVVPLLDVFRKISDKIPGFKPEKKSEGEFGFSNKILSGIIIELMKKSIKPVISETISNNKDFFNDLRSKRAMLDIGSLILVEDISEIKEKILKLITWEHPWVSGSSRSVLIHHVFINYEKNVELLQNWFYYENLHLLVRNNILHALVYGTIARMLSGNQVNLEIADELMNEFIIIWQESDNISDEYVNIYNNRKDFNWLMLNVLFGILYIEAKDLQNQGRSNLGFSGISKLLEELTTLDDIKIEFILEAFQMIGFQGFIEFALSSILNNDFKDIWEKNEKTKAYAYFVLGNLRGLFQSDVDNLLQEKDYKLGIEIKKFSYSSNPEVMSHIGYRLWIMVGTAINMKIMKMSGIMLVQLVYAKNESEFIDKAIKALLWMFFEPERIDIFHANYGLAHDKNWDKFDKLEIDRNVLSIRPELNDYYKKISNNIIEDLGKGILYGEL